MKLLLSVVLLFFLLQGFTYPSHVGLSIGTPIDPIYVLMEVHYDNPTLQQGNGRITLSF